MTNAEKIAYVREQLYQKFGKRNLAKFLTERPTDDNLYYEHWPQIWSNLAPYMFVEKSEDLVKIFEKYAIALETTLRGQLPVEGLVAFLVNSKAPGITVYPLHEGYLVKYGNRSCVLDRKNKVQSPENFNTRDLVWELVVNYWDETKDFLLEKMNLVVDEFVRERELAFDKAVAISSDGKSIATADVVVVVYADGRNSIFAGDLFCEKKITKPAGALESYWASDLDGIRRVVAKVSSGKLEAVVVSPKNCMTNSYLVIKEKYLPYIPKRTRLMAREILPR